MKLQHAVAYGLLGCGLALGPTSAALAQTTNDEIALYQGEDRQQMLEKGACEEGKVVWYSTANVENAILPIQDAFHAKYPCIEIEYIFGTGSQLTQRAQAEARAHAVTVDVMASGSVDNLGGTGLLQKFYSPTTAEYPAGSFDPNGEWVANWMGYSGIGWNPTLVKPEEVPTTWEGLADIDPKFKGQIVWQTSPTAGGPRMITHFRQMWGDEKTEAFLQKLSALDLRASAGNSDQVVDSVSVGEYAFVLGADMHVLARHKHDGQVIDGKNLDPAIVRRSEMGIMAGAPHPHAAMLFMDFLMAADGGQAFNRDGQFVPANPSVKPLPHIEMAVPSLNGVGELPLDGNTEAAMSDKSVEMFKTYFNGQ